MAVLQTKKDIDRFIQSETYLNEQFIPVAQDFFFFTENTISGKTILPVVIGRNRYDNYLLNVCKEDMMCTLVDVSESCKCFDDDDEEEEEEEEEEDVDSQ